MSEDNNNLNHQQQHVHQSYPYYNPYATQAYYPNYYRQFPTPQQQQQTYQQQPQTNQNPQQQQIPGMLPMERSYIENILRLNRGKLATVYMTFEGSEQQTFKGIVEAAGRDHIILSDPDTGKRYLLLMVYLDYVTFDEEINYDYPFNSGNQNTLSNYPPR